MKPNNYRGDAMKLKSVLLFVLALAAAAMAQAAPGTAYQGAFFQAPYVTAGTGLAVNYTAGSLYLGNGPVAVASGSVGSLAASQNACARPTYTACNIIYSNSTGTIAATTSIATAQASGNSILAFVQTSVSAVTTVQYPWQDTGFPSISLSGAFVLSTASITPTATAATIGVATQTFTLTGALAGDTTYLFSAPAPTALCPPVGARATATNVVSLDFYVGTAAACTPAPGVYKFLVVR